MENLPKPLVEAFEKIEELEKSDLRNTIINVKGRQMRTTRAAIQKAYYLLDTILPKSVACVEKVLTDEMRKDATKRDGYLVLGIAKFLASRRLPEVGKVDPMKEEEVKVELTLPRPKRIEKKFNPEDMPAMRREGGEEIRFKSNYPVDMVVRSGTTGEPVEIEDITEDKILDEREEAGTYGIE